jgi:6-pyruvoyltetrahydropterin/6-carboxytetrahydropterin synthase
MTSFKSTKIIELGSCAFRQPNAKSHCRFLHGYRLTAKFWFECTTLDDNNWVVDFGGLKPLKERLQKQFDHTTCIAGDDPNLLLFQKLDAAGACDLRVMPNGTGIERIAEYCYKLASEFISYSTNDRCWVRKVEVWEHADNSVIYKPSRFEVLHATTIDEKIADTTLNSEINDVVNNNIVAQSDVVPEPVQSVAATDQSPKNTHGHIPARVGNVAVTHNMGNPFGGTSWGARSADSMRS